MTDPNERHQQRSAAPEAALGVPNPDFCDPYGPLLIPYLSPSWREIRIVGHLHLMDSAAQAQAIYMLLARRLPALSWEEFEDLTSPDHFMAWWRATRPPREDEQAGGGPDPTIGRAPSRPSPFSVQPVTGTTRR